MLADRPDAETSNRLAHQARCRASDRQPIDSESTISEDLRNGPPVEQLKPVYRRPLARSYDRCSGPRSPRPMGLRGRPARQPAIAGQTGGEMPIGGRVGRAAPQALPAQAAAQRDGRLRTGTSFVGKWLKFRRWPTLSAPVTRDEIGFRVDADKPNGEAWLRYWARHGQRSLPVGRDGWFIRRLPTEWPPEQ